MFPASPALLVLTLLLFLAPWLPLQAAVWLTDPQIVSLRERLEKKSEPTISAWPALKADADAALSRPPVPPAVWYVPARYKDRDGHYRAKDGLMNDANGAYAMALVYRMTGEARYAAGAARVINAWTAGVQSMETRDDSRLSFTYHFPAMIFAADLIRLAPEWPAAEQEQFRQFLRMKALPMNTMERDNNWGSWGVVLTAAAGAFLEDRALLDTAARRWMELLDHQLDEKGHLPLEVHRNDDTGSHGIWYTHFSLMPLTLGAEILRLNGRDPFDQVSPHGRTLRSTFPPIAAWSLDPASFPYFKGKPEELYEPDYYSYFELLNPRWPDPNATALLRKKRPLTAIHSAPWLTFTHGQPLPE